MSDIFIRHLLEDGGLPSVVQAQNQDPSFSLLLDVSGGVQPVESSHPMPNICPSHPLEDPPNRPCLLHLLQNAEKPHVDFENKRRGFCSQKLRRTAQRKPRQRSHRVCGKRETFIFDGSKHAKPLKTARGSASAATAQKTNGEKL